MSLSLNDNVKRSRRFVLTSPGPALYETPILDDVPLRHVTGVSIVARVGERAKVVVELEALGIEADLQAEVQFVAPLSPEEIKLLLDVLDEASYSDERSALRAKLEAMR